MKTRYLLITIAVLLSLVPGAQAVEPAPAKAQAIQTQNLSSKRAINAEQYAGAVASNIVKKMQGTNTADQINPIMWQRMQESLTAYLHALVADQIGGGGSSGSSPSKGMCMPVGEPICVGGTNVPDASGSLGSFCFGRSEAQCQTTKGSVHCQNDTTLKTYTQTYGCLWVAPKGMLN